MCVTQAILVPEMSLKTIDQVTCKRSDDIKKSKTRNKEEAVICEDILAVFTYYTKKVLFSCGTIFRKFEESNCYKIFSSTTQPAHVVTLIAVTAIGCLMYSSPSAQENKPSPILTLLYLGSVSAHFGAQLWMSFVSGLSLYFCLPRHTFGRVQRVLFPKYFLLNSILSLISLSVFLNHNNSKLDLPQVSVQIGALTICFLIELIVRLYLTPPLLRLMEKTNEFEEAAGVGMEIGKHDAGALKNNEQYLKVYKSFRKVHMTIAIGNLITMGCSILHLQYISNKLILL